MKRYREGSHRTRRLVIALVLAATLAPFGASAAWRARHTGIVMASFAGPDFDHPMAPAIVADLMLTPASTGQSTRWEGYLEVNHSDVYEFWVEGTGFYRLFVDEIPVVDDWDDYGLGEVAGRANLSRGVHNLRLEHRLRGGAGRLSVAWASPRFARRSLVGALLHR